MSTPLELLNPDKTWNVGSSGNLNVVKTTTTKADNLEASTTAGVMNLNSQVKFGGQIDFNGQSIVGNNSNLTGLNQVQASSITATAGLSGDLTGNVTGNVSSIANHNTDTLNEGTSNKYYTNARARAAVSVTDNGGDGSLAYDSVTGVISYTGPDPADIRDHFSGGTGVDITSEGVISIGQAVETTSDVEFNKVTAPLEGNVTGNVVGNVTGTVSSLANHDTDDVAEGNNKYFTDGRARAAMSVTDNGGDGSMSYDSATGAVSYTGPNETEVRAHFSGATGVDITNGAVSIGQPVETTSDVEFNQVTADVVGNVTGNVTGTVSSLANHDTNDVAEGTNNLYFTDERAQAAAQSTIDVANTGTGFGSLAYADGIVTYSKVTAANVKGVMNAGTNVSYDNATGTFDIPQSVAATADATFNTVTADLVGNANTATQAVNLDNHTTDALNEGANLYHTISRVRAALSAIDNGGDGSLAYNSTTGQITYTGPNAAEIRAHITAGTGVAITDGAIAIGQDVAPNANVAFGSVNVLDTVTVGLAPTNDNHVATKTYVDSLIQGLDAKNSVKCASTVADGNITLSGNAVTIDGQSLVDGDRVLLKEQTSAPQNGIYVVNASGTWARSLDFDEPSEVKGAFVFVEKGAVNANQGFVQVGNDLALIGSDDLVFTQFSGAGSVQTGTGLSRNGNTIFLNDSVPNVTNVGTLSGLTMGGEVDLQNHNIVNGGNIAGTFAGNLSGDVTGNVTGNADTATQANNLNNHDTDDVVEGTGNLYFTDARAQAAAKNTISAGTTGTGYGDLAYNSATGALTLTKVSAANVKGSLTAGNNTSYNPATGAFDIPQSVGTTADPTFNTVIADLVGNADTATQALNINNHNTGALSEGTNLYFTDARAQAAAKSTISAGTTGTGYGDLEYDNATGALTLTKVSAANVKGSLAAGVNTSYNSSTGAFDIPQSVAADANPTFGTVTADLVGNVTGNVTGTVSSVANHDTDDIVEGANNLYFTDARAQAAANSAISAATSGTGYGNLDFDDVNGIMTYTKVSAADVKGSLAAGTNTSYDPTHGAFDIPQSVETTASPTFDTVNANLIGNVTGNVVGNLNGSVITDNAGSVKIKNAAGNYVGIVTPDTVASDYSLFLPANVGANDEVLKSDGLGNLTWGSGGSGVVKQVIAKTQYNSAPLPDAYTTLTTLQKPAAYSLNITPLSTTGKIMINFKVAFRCSVEPLHRITFSIIRTIGGVETTILTEAKQGIGNAGGPFEGIYHSNFVDTPATTSEVTYAVAYVLEADSNFIDSPYSSGIIGSNGNCLVLQEVEGSGVASSLFGKAADALGAFYNKGTIHIGSNFNAANSQNTGDVALKLTGAIQNDDNLVFKGRQYAVNNTPTYENNVLSYNFNNTLMDNHNIDSLGGAFSTYGISGTMPGQKVNIFVTAHQETHFPPAGGVQGARVSNKDTPIIILPGECALLEIIIDGMNVPYVNIKPFYDN